MLQKFNPHWRFPFYIRPTLYIKDIKFQKIIHFIGHHLIGIYCLIIISALVTSMEYYSWIQNSKSVLYYFWNSDCMIAFYGHSTSELQITVPNQPWFSEHWSAFHYLPFSCFPNSSRSWKPCFFSFLSTLLRITLSPAVREIIQDFLFVSGSFHLQWLPVSLPVAANGMISFFDLDDEFHCVYTPSSKVYSPNDSEGLFHFVAVVNCAAVNTRRKMSLWPADFIPFQELDYMHIFAHFHAAFQNGRTYLHF